MNFLQGDVFEVDLPRRGFDFIYADPPYAGCRFKYARQNNSRQWGKSARADFLRELIARMDWLRAPEGICGVSMSTGEALKLGYLFPSNARQVAWVKPFAVFRPHVWPAYAWEPVVLWGKFPGRAEQLQSKTPPDWFSCSPRVPSKGGHETPKPVEFATWILNQMAGPKRGRFLELFSGTGTVSREAERLGFQATAVDVTDYSVKPTQEAAVLGLSDTLAHPLP